MTEEYEVTAKSRCSGSGSLLRQGAGVHIHRSAPPCRWQTDFKSIFCPDFHYRVVNYGANQTRRWYTYSSIVFTSNKNPNRRDHRENRLQRTEHLPDTKNRKGTWL